MRSLIFNDQLYIHTICATEQENYVVIRSTIATKKQIAIWTIWKDKERKKRREAMKFCSVATTQQIDLFPLNFIFEISQISVAPLYIKRHTRIHNITLSVCWMHYKSDSPSFQLYWSMGTGLKHLYCLLMLKLFQLNRAMMIFSSLKENSTRNHISLYQK